VSAGTVDDVARQAKAAAKPVVLLGTTACDEASLAAAGRLAAAGVRVLTDTFVGRQPRGAGRFAPDRMMYFGEMALNDLAGVDLMVLVETTAPVAFFAYPDKPSVLVPEGCETLALAERGEDGAAALNALADALGAPKAAVHQPLKLPEAAPTGPLTPAAVGQSIARLLPEGAIVSDDSVTAGQSIINATRTGRPHDWLGLTGGAIGQGIPVAVGAAVAAGAGRKMVSLNGDGAGMYTVQGLWTLAREGLDVCVVVFANNVYRILGIELGRTGAGEPGPASSKLLELGNPTIDWVSLAKGLGVPAVRCQTAETFDAAFARAMAEPGPSLIEAVVP
jgi:acetolactate synthase-1/2/3 large subunit